MRRHNPPNQIIRVGKFYTHVGLCYIRKVIELTPDGQVRYQQFCVGTGKPTPAVARVKRSAFLKWATREATADQISRLLTTDTDGVT